MRAIDDRKATPGVTESSPVSKALPHSIQKAAARKLEIIDAAKDVDDLRIPPGNRLEALSESRKGQHSVRVNEQWRICFIWKDGNAHNVEIVDYH